MTLSVFLLVKAVISLIFGIPMALLPTALAPLYGYPVNQPVLNLMTQYLGATFIGIGLVCLLVKDLTDVKTLQAVTLALFVGDTVGFVVGLLSQFGPAASPLAWLNVLIWLCLAAGLGYFRFFKLKAS